MKKIAIRENYIDVNFLNRFTEEQGKQLPYNFSFVEVPNDRLDCVYSDFDINPYKFNETKYNARKLLENNQSKIGELKQRLSSLSEDIIQSTAGEIIDDIEARKAEFVKLHNELRVLLGKSERKVEKVI